MAAAADIRDWRDRVSRRVHRARVDAPNRCTRPLPCVARRRTRRSGACVKCLLTMGSGRIGSKPDWPLRLATRHAPCLGLTVERFDALAKEVDAVITAAHSSISPIPTEIHRSAPRTCLAPKRCCDWPRSERAKPFHHVSTTAVFGSSNYPSGTVVREGDEPVHTTGFGNGYSQTKWVAEKLVRIARNRGLPVSIYRPQHPG